MDTKNTYLSNLMHKKIIFVSNTSWFCYNFCIDLMCYLRKRGWEVIAVAPYDEFAKMIVQWGFKFIALKSLDRKGINPIKDLVFLLELKRLYREENPGIVVHFTLKPSLYGAISSRLEKVKSISVDVGLGYLFIRKSPLRLFIKLLYKVSCLLADKLIIQNDEDKKIIVGNKGCSNGTALIIPSLGVNTDYFSPAICKDKENNKITFLMFCRLLWTKGIKEFVDAGKEVKKSYPNCQFWLLGPIDKDHPAAIAETEIIKMQDEGSIRYIPYTQDHRPYICISDVVVLPSYREGLSSSLLEAMAMEKPVITTDVPGCRETIGEGVNGFLVPAKNARALASAMIKIIEIGEKERKKMGIYGRKKVLREFDKEVVCKRYMETIEEVLNHDK